MYRPTVRYDKKIERYVMHLKFNTDLTYNQIFRAAIFTAPFNPYFLKLMEGHKKHENVIIPKSPWYMSETELWKGDYFERMK